MSASAVIADQVSTPTDLPPLVVDLDGTLVRTDTLVECLIGAISHPLKLLRALMSLRHGRAQLKRELALIAAPDPALRPYNENLLAFLRDEQKNGRAMILATAADNKNRAQCGAASRPFRRSARFRRCGHSRRRGEAGGGSTRARWSGIYSRGK